MYQNKFKENQDYKAKIDAYRPLNQNTIEQIKEYYRVGLTYTSNALEGNTLDLAETKVILEDGLTIGGKPLKDHLEVMGHAKAFNKLLELVQTKTINENNIKELHKLFYNQINPKQAGKYRTKSIIVTGSDIDFPKPETINTKMNDFITKIQQMRCELNPIEFAAMVHAMFVNIHPFIDGNGRVARLLMNLILLQEGYNITIIPPVVRADYIRALQATNHNNFEPFINFISEMVLESQKEYLRIIKSLN